MKHSSFEMKANAPSSYPAITGFGAATVSKAIQGHATRRFSPAPSPLPATTAQSSAPRPTSNTNEAPAKGHQQPVQPRES